MQHIIKSLSILLILLMMNSCGITRNIVWGPNQFQEKFYGFTVGEGNKVLLIGESQDYLFEDEKQIIRRILINREMEGIYFDISGSYLTLKDSIISNRLDLKIRTKDLSNSQQFFLKSIGFRDAANEYKMYVDIKGISVPKAKKYQIIIPARSVKNDQEMIWHIWLEPTPLQTTGKILLTPFSLIADVILLPLTIPLFAYHHIKESQANYYCQGQFCNFDKININSNNQQKNP